GLGRTAAKDRAAELLEAFDLEQAAGRLVKNYSGGMRRRLDIAASIIVTPQLMFLDEPTTGLDPRSRNQVWDIVRTLAGSGTTILLCTQYLDEADQLADGIAVIDHGRVIAEGTSRDLKASVGSNALHLRLASADQRGAAQEAVARVLGDGVLPTTDPMVVAARLENPGQAADVLAALTAGRVEIAEFSVGTPSLDEVFLALTGHRAESAPEATP
ncbi:MAG: ATP-binding cassette domain-containing protein, partial [Gemmatimonadales bacterium]